MRPAVEPGIRHSHYQDVSTKDDCVQMTYLDIVLRSIQHQKWKTSNGCTYFEFYLQICCLDILWLRKYQTNTIFLNLATTKLLYPKWLCKWCFKNKSIPFFAGLFSDWCSIKLNSFVDSIVNILAFWCVQIPVWPFLGSVSIWFFH